MNDLKKVLSEVLNVNESEINRDSSPENISSWDSFNGLILVSELESNFNVKFTTEEIYSVKKVADIIKILKSHGVTEGLGTW